MSCRRLFLLFVVLLAVYCAGNWALPLIDRDEPRFAEASREMLQRRDFVIPYFNNQFRFDKPPLIYWLQCGAYRLLGTNEFAARLPSALCAALAALVTAAWAARLWGERAGWRAGLIFGLCLQTIVHAHASVADMAMIAACTASAWAGWNWLDARARGANARIWRWWLAFWTLLAVGFLAKGPIAWIPIGMAGWTAARSPRRPGAAEWLAGLVLMLAIVAAWGVPALIRTHGAFAAVGLGRHVVLRSVAPLQGHGARTWWSYVITFPLYFVTIWPSFFPWCLWLPAASAALWARRRTLGHIETYLLTGIFLIFVIFTLSRTKLPHYTLPAFPFLAMLLAQCWEGWRPSSVFSWATGTMVAMGLIMGLVLFPVIRPYFASEALYRETAPLLAGPMELATVEYQEPSLLWLFRSRIAGYDTSINWKDAGAWMQKPGPRVLVLPVTRLHDAFRKLDPSWRMTRAWGIMPANGRQVELAAVVKQ